jgi:hypothetical protein
MKSKGDSSLNNIRVAVRVRPPLSNEVEAGSTFDKLNVD